MKKMDELISVIVPVYNMEKYLPKCIDSILNQTYENIELILIDDGSTDSSGAICDLYSQRDKRVRVIHKENGGQASARNVGLDIANGTYIGFVDSDDWILPEMYETLYQCIWKYSCDIAVCARFLVRETGEVCECFTLEKETVMNTQSALRSFLRWDHLDSSSCDKLFTKACLKGIRYPSEYICEDVDFVYHAVERAECVVHCGKPLYCYLQRDGSTSHGNFSEKTKGLEIRHREVCEAVKEKYPELSCEAEYFYLSRIHALFEVFEKSGYKGEYREWMLEILKKNFLKIMRNPCFSSKEQIWLILIRMGLFPYARKLRIRLKNQ